MSEQQPGPDPYQPPAGQPVPPPPPPPAPYQQPYQQPGYPPVQQPGYGMVPVIPGTAQGYPPNADERLWATLSHASFFVLGIIGPIIVMLTKGKESPFVRKAAVEALNFHISLFIYYIVSAILIFVIVGILTLFATVVFGIVVAIMAIVAANKGQDYRYPLTIRMVT